MDAVLGPIRQGEIKRLRFDFSTEVSGSVTLSSVTLTCSTHEGDEQNPSGVLVGVPMTVGFDVFQLVQPADPGSVVMIRALATASDGTRHDITGYLKSV